MSSGPENPETTAEWEAAKQEHANYVLRPGDKIVMTVDPDLSLSQILTFKESLEDKFPGHEVIVLAGVRQFIIERQDDE